MATPKKIAPKESEAQSALNITLDRFREHMKRGTRITQADIDWLELAFPTYAALKFSKKGGSEGMSGMIVTMMRGR